ncbi:MAG: cytochrome c [Calditrichaeota bacterium]|nr:cytochrome c [Calditrichota bacterium]
MRSLKSIIKLTSFGLILFLFACSRTPDKREYQVMNDMYYSYADKAQEEKLDSLGNHTGLSVMRNPVAGTIPRGFEPYTIENPEDADVLVNPLPMTKSVIETGRRYFNINCVPCHGKNGAGDGTVVTLAQFNPRMPKPPELYTQKVKDWPDGRIFHIITKGQNNMPAYGNRIDKTTRWAIINYVRILQKARDEALAKN